MSSSITISNSTRANRTSGRAETVAFAGTGAYEELLVIDVSGVGGNFVRISGTVATSALTGLKVTSTQIAGETHVDYLVDGDLDTPSNVLPWTSKTSAGASLAATPAGSTFSFLLDVRGLDAIALHVKSAGAGSVAFKVSA